MLKTYERVLDEVEKKKNIVHSFPIRLLKRRKNFDKKEEDVIESDLHTSKSLYRKWGDIKSVVNNTIMPVYKEMMANCNEIPTDFQLQNVLNAIRTAEEKITTRTMIAQQKIIDANHQQLLVDNRGNESVMSEPVKAAPKKVCHN